MKYREKQRLIEQKLNKEYEYQIWLQREVTKSNKRCDDLIKMSMESINDK